ncbi:hypothetical protein AVEN_236858-1 [Araneus ventricosus]|uniref:Uncharacterized protein n=1 Tax=Araneus ventricosus TaxID=182803 RepID=A0A4Y2LUE3_ARAVE|nr:hypothetical protein AVEN_236858-1 [Araneus ventricosus]
MAYDLCSLGAIVGAAIVGKPSSIKFPSYEMNNLISDSLQILVYLFPMKWHPPSRESIQELTMPTFYEKEMQRLRKLLAEAERDEDSDFDNEDNGHENILEENFSGHERFSEHDPESEEDGYSGNEE